MYRAVPNVVFIRGPITDVARDGLRVYCGGADTCSATHPRRMQSGSLT